MAQVHQAPAPKFRMNHHVNIRRASIFALVLTACCRAPTPPKSIVLPEAPTQRAIRGSKLLVRATDGHAAAWAAVYVREPTTNTAIGFFRGNASGEVAIDVAPGAYSYEVTAPTGYAKITSLSDGPTTRVDLNSDCEQTVGTARGDIPTGDFVWLRNIVTNDYYGAIVRPDGAFTFCTPPGTYAIEAHDDQEAPPFFFESGTRVDFEAYTPKTIDELPPEIARLPVETSLAPLLNSDVRVIGIGEANHGSHEFIALRTSESLRLAKTSDVRFIALEAGPAEVIPLDDYVHDRVANVADSVATLGYWMWDTKDMLASLDQIRQYNRSVAPDARVSLVGIDVQYSSRAASYLLDAGISLSPEQRIALDTAVKAKTLKDIEPSTAVGYLERLADLRGRALPFRTAMALEQLLWRLRMYSAQRSVPYAERERGMTALVEQLLVYAGDKRIVVWAHNTHVSADAASEYRPLGSQLRARIGSKYLAVGLLMGKGTFRAWDNALAQGVVPHTVEAPPPASLEAVLARFITKGYGFVRLRDVPDLAKWLGTPRRSVENGGVMPYKNHWLLRRQLASFDVVGFVAEVSPTTPTPTGVRRPEDRPK